MKSIVTLASCVVLCACNRCGPQLEQSKPSPSSSSSLDSAALAPGPLLGAGSVLNTLHGTQLVEAPELRTKSHFSFDTAISLESPDKDLRGVDDRQIVLSKEALILLDYPIKGTWVFPLPPAAANGWTRAQLVRQISELYKHVYAEEARTTATPPGRAGELWNRNETNGTYGLWGHELGDLVLEGFEISADADGRLYIVLLIGS